MRDWPWRQSGRHPLPCCGCQWSQTSRPPSASHLRAPDASSPRSRSAPSCAVPPTSASSPPPRPPGQCGPDAPTANTHQRQNRNKKLLLPPCLVVEICIMCSSQSNSLVWICNYFYYNYTWCSLSASSLAFLEFICLRRRSSSSFFSRSASMRLRYYKYNKSFTSSLDKRNQGFQYLFRKTNKNWENA